MNSMVSEILNPCKKEIVGCFSVLLTGRKKKQLSDTPQPRVSWKDLEMI